MSATRWLAVASLVVGAWVADTESAAAQSSVEAAALERRVLEHATRLEEAGREEEAMRALEHLLEEQPVSVSALVLLAQMGERSGDPGRVLPAAEAAVLLDESGLAAVRQLWIRALQAAGLRDSAVAAARRWTEEEPTRASPYAELSGLWAQSGDSEAAIRTLEAGRAAIGSEHLFAQELAVLQAERGAYPAAAKEWRSMLAWGDAGIEAVERRVSDSGTGRSEALAALRAEVAGSEATFLERKGGLRLALLFGEAAWAQEIAQGLIADLPGPAGDEVLRDYVARARSSGDLAGAAWAARSLAGRSRSADEVTYWTAVAADIAYEAGDLEGARQSFRRLASDVPPGSDLYGLSLRRLHALTVDDDPDGAEAMLREHQDLYPEEGLASAEMSVRTAQAWMAEGDLGRARAVVEAVSVGDAEQAALQAGALGWLEMLAGRPEAARGHLELAAAVPTARPGFRIEALELLSLIDGADSASVASLGRGVVAATASDDARPLVESVERWAGETRSGGDRLAALAARELEVAGHVEEARTVRLAILQAWPESAAAPRALLELARGGRIEDPRQATAWLERLIVDYPESALAPVARRLLSEWQDRIPGV